MSGQTVKYNLKKRLGRGFTFEELKVMSPSCILRCCFLADALMHRSNQHVQCALMHSAI